MLIASLLIASDNMIPFARTVCELQDLPLADHVKEGRLGESAARLLPELEDRIPAWQMPAYLQMGLAAAQCDNAAL